MNENKFNSLKDARFNRLCGLLAISIIDPKFLNLVAGCCLITAKMSAAPTESTIVELPLAVRENLQKQGYGLARSHLEYSESRASDVQPAMNREALVTENYDDGKFFQHTQVIMDGNTKTPIPIIEVAFDGKNNYLGSPSQSTLRKARPDDQLDPTRTYKMFSSMYGRYASFYVPESLEDIQKKAFPESLVLHYLGQSDSTAIDTVGEKLCVTVRVPDPVLLKARDINLDQERKRLDRMTRDMKSSGISIPLNVEEEITTLAQKQQMVPKRTIKFLLDPTRGYAVVEREERTDDGKLIVSVVPSDWKFYNNNIWIPHHCKAMYYTYPSGLTIFSNVPIYTITITLKQIDFGSQTNIQYTLENKPDYKKAGTHIIDRSCAAAQENPKHRVDYLVAADGTLLKYSAALALRLKPTSGRFVIVLVFAVIALLPATFFFFSRRTWKKRG